MQWLAGILALLIGIAGWFYLFYSRAAHRLTGMENTQVNTLRIIFRRIAGVALLLLAGFFYVGFTTLDKPLSPRSFIFIWAMVLGLLLLVLMLGLIDLRYTLRFYRERNSKRS
ncbi:MAG TPA: hypothetical protein VGG19_20570 [Tepidisphaeraceae bacterium]|jgi:drug/metabolite transporter (DMT)-like permease